MTRTIAIIGAGFSGLSLAAYLHRLSKSPLRVLLIESNQKFGMGIAYSTQNPLHLLNVRANDMSAFHEEPDHLVKWLNSSSFKDTLLKNSEKIELQFIPRYIYCLYLQSILASISKPSAVGTTVELVQGRAVQACEDQHGITLSLQDGTTFHVDQLILAHGHLLPPLKLPSDDSIQLISNPWNYASYKAIPKDASVLIVGTGLTMIDAVIELKSHQHNGMIYAISRRGLIPQVHKSVTSHYPLNTSLLPQHLPALIRYIKKEIKKLGEWQPIMIELRKQASNLWQHFNLSEKKQFLRHVLPYWETHRHRMAPEIEAELKKLEKKDKIKYLAGRILEIKNSQATIQPRHTTDRVTFPIQWVIDCVGSGNYRHASTGNPIVDSLLQQGIASKDQLSLGLQISSNSALIDNKGHVSNKFFVLGPACRGTLWESTAVPDIRRQSFELANYLTNITPAN